MSLANQTSLRWRQLFALGWLSIVLLMALLADQLPLAYGPATTDLAHIADPPFSGAALPPHWLGTDPYGRDVLAGLLFGARTAMLVSLPAAGLAMLLGITLGSIAGFWGNTGLRFPLSYWLPSLGLGVVLFLSYYTLWPTTTLLWPIGSGLMLLGILLIASRVPLLCRTTLALPIDRLVMGTIALLESIPRLILVLIVAATQDTSLFKLVAILSLTYWTGPARLVRAEVLRVRTLPYVEAARSTGVSSLRLLLYHILPNASAGARTAFPLSVAALIGLETTLSFLGIGLPPETASWGRLMATARLDTTTWWLVAIPASVLLCTMLALRQVASKRI